MLHGARVLLAFLFVIGTALAAFDGIPSAAVASGPYDPPQEPGGYSARIGSTQQAFERGWMTWRADSGMIWVFLESGQVHSFSSAVYGGLPHTALYPQPPAGRTLPRQGFKQVYDNFPDIRAALGWALGGEQGFLMDFQTDFDGNLWITLADGSPVQITSSGEWSYVSAFPTPEPEQQAPPVVLSFTVEPTTINRGETVTIAWNVQGAGSVDVIRGALGVPSTLGHYPPVGSMQYTATASDVYEIPFSLRPLDSAGRYDFDRYQFAVITVTIRCPYTYFFGQTSLPDVAGTCPLDDVQSAPGAFQPFEGGMMIWRGDTREILVLDHDGQFWPYPDTWAEGEPVSTPDTPPAGRYVPVRGFGKIWATETWQFNANAPLRQGLGWATAPEQAYSIRLQTVAFKNRYLSGYVLSLPDGRAIFMDTRARRWQWIAP